MNIDTLGSAVDSFIKVNDFWTDVFKAYEMLGESVVCENTNEISAKPIFCNDKIKIGNMYIAKKKQNPKNNSTKQSLLHHIIILPRPLFFFLVIDKEYAS